MEKLDRKPEDIEHFIAHPGGKKVLSAYEKSLSIGTGKTEHPRNVLRDFGNMSSPTVLYVLKEFIDQHPNAGEQGLLTALGPGFSSEMLWLEWREKSG